MTETTREPVSGSQRIPFATLRNAIAAARALLDMVDQRLPFARYAEATSDALATQVAEELLRVARDLVRCARTIAPDLEPKREADAKSAA
jgi:hypothetical protein